MGIRKLEAHGYTPTLDRVIIALCADYDRRKSAVAQKLVNPRCTMEYKYLNYRIYEAAAEIVGAAYAELYIDEIGRSVGYAKTAHPAAGEQTYKTEKQEVKHNIARKLHLI